MIVAASTAGPCRHFRAARRQRSARAEPAHTRHPYLKIAREVADPVPAFYAEPSIAPSQEGVS